MRSHTYHTGFGELQTACELEHRTCLMVHGHYGQSKLYLCKYCNHVGDDFTIQSRETIFSNVKHVPFLASNDCAWLVGEVTRPTRISGCPRRTDHTHH